jgi:hypothetical protein
MNSVAAGDKGLNLGVFGNLPPNSGGGLALRRRLGAETRFVSETTVCYDIPEWMFTVDDEQTFRTAASEFMVQFFFI